MEPQKKARMDQNKPSSSSSAGQPANDVSVRSSGVVPTLGNPPKPHHPHDKIFKCAFKKPGIAQDFFLPMYLDKILIG